MGRPSRIEVRVSGGGVRVSGKAVLVVEGRLRIQEGADAPGGQADA